MHVKMLCLLTGNLHIFCFEFICKKKKEFFLIASKLLWRLQVWTLDFKNDCSFLEMIKTANVLRCF